MAQVAPSLAITAYGQRRRPAAAAGAAALFLLLGLGAALRLFCLGADPSPSLEYYYITDEGWWVHNARNAALFGRWVLDEFNQGFLYAPVHSLLLLAAFRTWGVGALPARAVSCGAGLLTGLFLYLAARAAGERRGTALLAAGLLVTSRLFASVNRLAYPESTMLCFAVLGWWWWLAGRPTLAGVAFGLSCFAKLAGVPGAGLPVFLLGLRLYEGLRPGGELRRLDAGERRRRIRREILRPGLLYLAGLGAVTGLVAAVFWLPNLPLLLHTYHLTRHFNSPASLWNAVGNLAQFPAGGFLAGAWVLVALAWAYLWARLGPAPAAPPAEAPATGPVEMPARAFVADPGHRLALVWLLLNALAVAPLRFHPTHRYLVFLPALAWLGARGVAELLRLPVWAAVRGVLGHAANWRLGVPLLLCWPLCRGLATPLAAVLQRTGLPAFSAGSAAAYFFAFVWCLLLCWLLLPAAGALCRRRSPGFLAEPAVDRAPGTAGGSPPPARGSGTAWAAGGRAWRAALVAVALAAWLGGNLAPAFQDVCRPSWDLGRMAQDLAPQLGAGARVMGLAADTVFLETQAFLFTPRIGTLNQDPYDRFRPTHVLVMSACDGQAVDQAQWFEEGVELCLPLKTAPVVDQRWAVDFGRPGAKRFQFILFSLEGH